MAIRLNKVLTELNIGLQTAVEFLKNEKNLGEIKDDANMNTKITDEQYRALVQKFKGDKDVKSEAEKIFAKKTKDKRADKKVTKAEELLEQRPLFKPLGKIDLDNMGKKTSKSSNTETTEPKKQSADIKVEEKKAETTDLQKAKTAEASATNSTVQTQEKSRKEDKPVAEQPQPKAAEARKPEAKQQNEKKSQPKSTEAKQQQTAEQPKTSVETKAESTKPKPAEESGTEKQQASSEPKIFTLKSEAKMAPKVNVLGKIDLDALNQSTRPKKKSKEERRKEREEKAAQQRGGAERKKRVRIGKERVDIEAAAKQTSGQATQNKKNKNGKPGTGNAGPQGNNNHAGDRQNNRKNRKNRNQPAKPLEVNEEDVARQVKETLARLTNTATQNKKGAKYRREKREAVQERLNEEMREEQAESKTLKLTEFVTVSELATMMNVPVNKVIGTCMNLGIMVSINQRLDAETVNIVADEFGFKTEYVSAEVSEAINEEADDESDLLPRAPIAVSYTHLTLPTKRT